jgi:hypothetical protein
MRPTLKKILIGSEVTAVLAASAVGVHFALLHNRSPVQPPPLFLPLGSSPPVVNLPSSPPVVSDSGTPRQDPNRGLLAGFSREDRNMLQTQWDVLQQLMQAVVGYVERRLVPQTLRGR